MKNLLYFLLGFLIILGLKPTNAIHADSPGVYTSDKILNLSTIDRIRLKCDFFDGSSVDGVRQHLLFSLVLDKPSACEVFYQLESIHKKKI